MRFTSKRVLMLCCLSFNCINWVAHSNAWADVLAPSDNETQPVVKKHRIAKPRPKTGGKKATEETPCEKFKDTITPDFKQAYIAVPENWDSPNSKKIKVFYYYNDPAASTDTAPAVSIYKGVSPLAFFNGGPLSTSHYGYSQLMLRPEIKNTIPMVFIDQRGTGCSDPLPKFEMSVTGAKRAALYGSESIVKDAEAIRDQILGPNSKWRIYGQSFGGNIIHRYLQVAPESLIAAYSHGFSIMQDGAESLKLRILAEKSTDARYMAKYPGDLEAITAIKATIPADKCYLRDPDGTEMCGPGGLDFLFSDVGWEQDWDDLHTTLTGMYNSQTKTVDQSELEKTFPDQDPDPSQENYITTVINESEENGAAGDKLTCETVMSRLKSEGHDPDSLTEWPINECRFETSFNYPFDGFISKFTGTNLIYISKIIDNMKKNPQQKFFLYGSGKDSFTAPESFNEEVGFFNQAKIDSQFTFRMFADTDHIGAFTENQIYADITSTNLLK